MQNSIRQTSPQLVLADLGDRGASEMVAAWATGARVVKAFNSIVTDRFNEGSVKNGSRRVIFVSGDDSETKEFIRELIKSFESHRTINPTGIVPLGPILDFAAPHDRANLGRACAAA
jgi:predicted dinucleotide-binding enzyme